MSTDGIAPPNTCGCNKTPCGDGSLYKQMIQAARKMDGILPPQISFAKDSQGDRAAPLGPPPVHDEYGQLPIRPRSNMVLLIMDEAPRERVSPGGVVIPGKQNLEDLGSVGEVVLIGPGRNQNGKHVPVTGLQIGDRVRLGQYASTAYERKHEGRTFVLVPDENIIGIEPPLDGAPEGSPIGVQAVDGEILAAKVAQLISDRFSPEEFNRMSPAQQEELMASLLEESQCGSALPKEGPDA